MATDSVAEVLATGHDGLTLAEARVRLDGLRAERTGGGAARGWFSVLLHQFRSPVVYILVVAALVTVALGEYIDALRYCSRTGSERHDRLHSGTPR